MNIEETIEAGDYVEADIINELYEICEHTYSSCSPECPVYKLNGNKVLDTVHDWEINRGCDGFKDGRAMLEFIKKSYQK